MIGGSLELNITNNECAIPTFTGTCLTENDKALLKLKDFLHHNNAPISQHAEASVVISTAKNILQVSEEADIWEHARIKSYLGRGVTQEVLTKRYKPKGPANSTALLDNFVIDNTLQQWMDNSDQFGKKFYHVKFQMIDFQEQGTELSRLDIGELVKQGYNCFGVVLNTDVSSGRGKHWFCLYGDMSGAGTKEDPYTLEYFNSSGNPPVSEVSVWMEHAAYQLLRDHGKHCEIIRSASRRLQHSKTECGMWSLLYIRSRLEDKPQNFFYTASTDDADMIRYRSLVFRPK
jgi:hypothetical protein